MELKEFQAQLDRIEATALAQKRVLSFVEATCFIGLSKSHMYKLTSNGDVPHYKPRGKMCYFDRLELENWLLQNRVAPIEELEAEAQRYCLNNKAGGAK